jgi:hypothetical protein
MSTFHVFCSEWSALCSFLAFRTQYTFDMWFLAASVPLSALLSFPGKQSPFAFWQADVCLYFFSMFGECMRIHCFDCSLISTFTNETQVSSFVMILLRNSSLSLRYHSKKSKPKPFSTFRVHLWAFSKPILHKTCDSLIENSAWNLWKFTQKFWNHEVSSFTGFWSTLRIRSSLITDSQSLQSS